MIPRHLLVAQFNGATQGISFQGYLTDDGGNPINTPQDIVIRLYDQASGGDALLTEGYPGHPVTNGVFNLIIEDPLFKQLGFDQQIWVQVEVNTEIISPRTQLASVPYALSLRNMRIQPVIPGSSGPNILGGYETNSVSAGVVGATISGGGDATYTNGVSGDYGTVAGGNGNAAHTRATVSGGYFNHANGEASVVAGGTDNDANGDWSTIGGGDGATATGNHATVAGGFFNHAPGTAGTVPGGRLNWAGGDYSFAAGDRAKVRNPTESGDSDGDEGTFVWSDRSNTETFFESTGPNQFLIEAEGGVGIDTNDPLAQLHIANATGAGNGLLVQANGGDGFNVYWIFDQNVTIDTYRGSDGRRLPIAFQPSGGNVGIGTTSPSEKLEVNGNVLANNVAVPSDARYKKNVAPINGALGMISEIEGVQYAFDREAFPEKDFDPGSHLGVIAQDVQAVLPELVSESESGYLSVNYMGLIPVLMEAVKEQQAQIKALKEEVIALKQATGSR
jgi:hypothetical protein